MSAHSYHLTTVSCFVGIFVQAIVANLSALLFTPMMGLYGFRYVHLGILVGVSFTTQVLADILFSGAIDRKGFRFFTLPTCVVAALGLVLYAATPVLFPGREFTGILVATVIFSFSSGLLEVLLSPIIDAIPSDEKATAMSFMHSFYAWGQATAIIVTTLFLQFVGIRYWQIIVLVWAVVPVTAFFLFLRAPFPPHKPAHSRQGMRQIALSPFYLLALLAIFGGASSEIVMNQWATTFVETTLHLPKMAGDLLGMCGFCLMMGLGRLLYGWKGSRISLYPVLIGGALLCVLCYVAAALVPLPVVGVAACALCGLGASLLWPGTLVITSARFPLAGAWLLAMLAAAGDIGASVGPWLTGLIADHSAGTVLASWMPGTAEEGAMRLGLLAAAIFPLVAMVCHVVLRRMQKAVDREGAVAP